MEVGQNRKQKNGGNKVINGQNRDKKIVANELLLTHIY